MKTFLTEKTRQEKIINEAQKRRNFFGLGLTSLIAACSADDAAEINLDVRPTKDLEAEKLVAMTGDFIAFAIETAMENDPTGRVAGKKNLKITIAEGALGAGSKDFAMTFKNGDHIAQADQYDTAIHKGLVAVDQYDLIISSSLFGDLGGTSIGASIYVVWDIGAGGTFVDASANSNDVIKKYLKVASFDGISKDHTIYNAAPDYPALHQNLGGETDQADMVFKSSLGYNILWDFTKHATTDVEGETLITLGDAGILTIGIGSEPGSLELIKINDNDNYDALVKKDDAGSTTYILWDVAKYYDANAVTPVVDFTNATTAAATATHGLLTIKGEAGINIKKAKDDAGKDNGFTDIDGGGTNDLAFVYDGNTYILFGEKVANIDGKKAISHTVSLSEVATGTFYSTADARTEDTAGAEGFFDFDLDGATGNDTVANVGYRFIGTIGLVDLTMITNKYKDVITPNDPGLSEEAYWDIA